MRPLCPPALHHHWFSRFPWTEAQGHLKGANHMLAFDADVDRSRVGGLERREENPTADMLDRLARR